MGNVNNPHGFRPLMRSVTGGPGQACVGAHKTAAITSPLFIQDAVALSGAGTKPTAAVGPATVASAIYGVNLIYGAGLTATDHLIILGHLQMFEAQIDTVTVAQLTMNAALVAGAGNAALHISGHSLNGVAVTNTLAVKLMGLYQSPDNGAGANARVIVTFNKSQLADQTAGA